MLYRSLVAFFALVGQASALRIAAVAPSSRTGAVSMGLAVGDKAPASLLSKAGIQGKKAVVFFYGAECVCRHRSREASFVATPPHPHVCLPCSSC